MKDRRRIEEGKGGPANEDTSHARSTSAIGAELQGKSRYHSVPEKGSLLAQADKEPETGAWYSHNLRRQLRRVHTVETVGSSNHRQSSSLVET